MTEPHIIFVQTAVDCNHHPHVNKKWRLGVGECYEDVMLAVRLVMCSKNTSPVHNTPIALKLMLRTSEHTIHDLNTTVVMNPPNSVQNVEVKLRKTPKQTKSRIVGVLLNTTEDVCRVVPSNSLHILSRRTRTIRRVLKKSLGKESAAITPEKWLEPYSQPNSAPSSTSPLLTSTSFEFFEESSGDSTDSMLGKRSRDGYSSTSDDPEPPPKARMGPDKRILPPISSLIAPAEPKPPKPQPQPQQEPALYGLSGMVQMSTPQLQRVPVHPRTGLKPSNNPPNYPTYYYTQQYHHHHHHHRPLPSTTPFFAQPQQPAAVDREF